MWTGKHWLAGLAAALVLTVLSVRLLTPAARNFKAEYRALEARMEEANDMYVRAVREYRNTLDAAKDAAPSVKKPDDPRGPVIKSIDDLAEAAVRAPEGAGIATQAFLWSVGLDLDTANLPGRLARLVDHFPNDPALADAVEGAQTAWTTSPEPGVWEPLLARLAERTSVTRTKTVALYSVGRLQLTAGKLREARAAFETVTKLSVDSPFAGLARGYLFEIDRLQPGMVAPPFTGKTLDGADFSSESLRGKPYLLNFWASWCPRCVSEVPDLQAAVKATKTRGSSFEVVAVSIDDREDNVAETAKAIGMPGIVLKPEGGFDHPIAKLYNVQSMPTWYLIDANGVIRARDPLGEKLMPALEALGTAQGSNHGGA